MKSELITLLKQIRIVIHCLFAFPKQNRIFKDDNSPE